MSVVGMGIGWTRVGGLEHFRQGVKEKTKHLGGVALVYIEAESI